MAKQFYAAVDANGPISISIEADTISHAVSVFSELDDPGRIDAGVFDADAENDLGFCGADMTPYQFEEAMMSKGFRIVADLDHGWDLFGR